ncbi:MAG TPA: hypothetical protein ENH10_09770 [Bacteroidetes bacterium]|nr:hypothetical protein BMS3Bbin04_01103 [bacterium BMS3Bbin04]HDO66295.1 hypothetical protein [Bacteroidota bacterium]HEX05420.1 hypothetical protein [Bacteroidota bacterium]
MSLLHAADHAQKARVLADSTYEVLRKIKAPEHVRQELIESCEYFRGHLNRIVEELEHALVREDETVAVTFFPFNRSDIRGSSARVAEAQTVYRTGNEIPVRTSGTMMLPFSPPDGDTK